MGRHTNNANKRQPFERTVHSKACQPSALEQWDRQARTHPSRPHFMEGVPDLARAAAGAEREFVVGQVPGDDGIQGRLGKVALIDACSSSSKQHEEILSRIQGTA